MAMHELATNAAKYGCLSNATGRVAVTWAMRDGTLTLTWREHGGPPVKAPARRGFGSRLLEQSVAHDLGGACRLDYAADGLVWKATVAL
jgi:two-component sensor histidine kinase